MDEIMSTGKLKKFFGEPVKKTSCNNILKTSSEYQELNMKRPEENISCFTQCGNCLNTILHQSSKSVISNHSLRVNESCNNFRNLHKVEYPSFTGNKTLNEITRLPSNINPMTKDSSLFLSNKFGLRSKAFFENKLKTGNFSSKGLARNFGMTGSFFNAFNTDCNVIGGENLQESVSNSFISGSKVTSSFCAKNSMAPIQLPGHYNCEKYGKNLSNMDMFNVISFSQKDSDVFAKSRLPFYHVENQKDSCSTVTSIVKASSGKAQITNLLENLHQRILNISPNLPVEAVRLEFEKAKEELESVDEFSFAHTIKDVDGVSIVSNVSKPTYSVLSTKTCEQVSVSLKSGKDVLKSLQSKNNFEGKTNLHSSEKKKKDSIFSSFQNELNASDKEDSALLFKKPKPFSRKKKFSNNILKIKTPPVVKNLSPRIANKIFSLKHWRPLPMGSDLVLCGVNENGKTIKTEAIKKRINNSRVELMGGITCNLIGSPVSTLPKKIILKLEKGFPRCWKLLQKELMNMSENQKILTTSVEIKKYHSLKSPKILEKKKETFKISKQKKKSTSKNKQSNIHFQGSFSKNKKLDATKKNSPTKTSPTKKEKTSPKQKKLLSIKNLKLLQVNTPNNNKNKDEICKTRSGRVVVPPNIYGILNEEKNAANSLKKYSEKINRKRGKQDIQQNEQSNFKKEETNVKYLDSSKKKITKKVSKGKKNIDPQIEEGDFELNLDDILIPQLTKIKGKMNLSKSQLRSINCETPPLKYFNSNLNLLNSVSSAASPDWCISQRTASEVKRFQKRKALNCTTKKNKKKKISNIVTPKKSFASKDLKNIVDWFAEEDVKTPIGNSKVVKYMISKRNNFEEDSSDEEENED